MTYSVHVNNHSLYALNGTQVRLLLAAGVSLAGTVNGSTIKGNEVVVTLGRLAAGGSQDLAIPVTAGTTRGEIGTIATVTSSTALPVNSNHVETDVR